MNQHIPIYRSAIGQSSRRFLPEESSKPCLIGGVIFDGVPGLDAESDGDVIYHAICNAISSLSGVPVLDKIAQDLCRKDGITDSQVYVEKALHTLGRQKIVHISLALEGKKPRIIDRIDVIRKRIAHVLSLQISQVGLTATSGEGLTDFGCGDGIQCLCILTSVEDLTFS